MAEQNKLVKTVTDSAVLVRIAAGVGYIAKKMLKENFLGDPSSNIMNYAKFTGVLAGSMALKTYLEEQKIIPRTSKMATMAMMLGGAILNATTFVGGSYLAKYLSGNDPKAALVEKERHDKALEKYQKDYATYQEDRQKLLDWQDQNRRNNAIASQNLENTDEALKLYRRSHPNENLQLHEPDFSDYYRPSKTQQVGEMVFVSGGMLVLGFVVSRWL